MRKTFVIAVLFGLLALPALKADAGPGACTTGTPPVAGISAGVGTEKSYSTTPHGTVPVDHTVVCVYEAPDEGREVRHQPGISMIGDPLILGGTSTLVGDRVHECWFTGGGHFLCASAGGSAIVNLQHDNVFVAGGTSACEIQDTYPQDTCYGTLVVVGLDGPTKPTMGVTFAAAVCEQRYNRPGLKCTFVNRETVEDILRPITFTRVATVRR